MPFRKKNTEISKKKGKKRSLRGLLTGESRRERKAKRAAERQVAIEEGKTPEPVQQNNLEDEEETVYGVNVDNSCANDTPISQPLLAAKKDDDESTLGMGALQVILLLMDPATRRFELLQLEFDSQQAVVRDVLAQVPHSVTEEALRKQNYSGVCDRKGQELYYSTCLGDVCTGSDILIALPENLDAKECARLARPILSDKNVIEMLKSSGIDVSTLEVASETQELPRSVPTLLSSEKKPQNGNIEGKTPVSSPIPASSNGLYFAIFVFLSALAMQVIQMSVTAPLGPGQSLSLNAFMSKCGYKAFLPVLCEEFSLIMSNDNTLTLYRSDGEAVWKILGDCEEETDVCEGGLRFNEDKTLTIGGKLVKQATVFGDEDPVFAPFPFTEPPKVRVIKEKN